jgi:hypothetical protein
MTWEQMRKWCPQVDDLYAPGDSWTVESPLHSKFLIGPDGIKWRHRGDRELDAPHTRRLLATRQPRVYHVYDTIPHEHTGPGLDALVALLEEFWAGRLDPMDSFRIGEFRSPEGDVMLVVEQSC